jgi:hypothetical protein
VEVAVEEIIAALVYLVDQAAVQDHLVEILLFQEVAAPQVKVIMVVQPLALHLMQLVVAVVLVHKAAVD